jgi:hypothetical protein
MTARPPFTRSPTSNRLASATSLRNVLHIMQACLHPAERFIKYKRNIPIKESSYLCRYLYAYKSLRGVIQAAFLKCEAMSSSFLLTTSSPISPPPLSLSLSLFPVTPSSCVGSTHRARTCVRAITTTRYGQSHVVPLPFQQLEASRSDFRGFPDLGLPDIAAHISHELPWTRVAVARRDASIIAK